MTRLPRALFLVLFVSCASPLPFMPLPDGGTGGSAGSAPGGAGGAGGASGVGSTGASGFGGLGGSGPVDGGLAADAGCAPFMETFMPACVACLGASCCDLATACFAVPDCFGYASCQQNCPPLLDGGVAGATNVCLSACATNYPMANPAFAAMTACLHQSCAAACPY